MAAVRRPEQPKKSRARWQVTLIGGIEVRLGDSIVSMSGDAERLIAFLALQTRPVPRPYVAGTLWPDSDPEHALGSLRTALWRIRRAAGNIVDCRRETLAVSEEASIDVEAVSKAADLVANPDCRPDLLPSDKLFHGELLPGWYEDWTLLEQERHRQIALHALERLAVRLAENGRFDMAIQAAMAAISFDPLRESPHRVLIEVHHMEGNLSEALRHHAQYCALIADEFGLEPSPLLERCVAAIADTVFVHNSRIKTARPT